MVTTFLMLFQTCHELNVKLSQLADEKAALVTDNERLTAQLSGHLNDPESIHMSMKIQEDARKEADQLREENYKLETAVDDYKQKLQVYFILTSFKFASRPFAAINNNVDDYTFHRSWRRKSVQHMLS